MKYFQWRDEIFGCNPGSDPVTVDFSDELYSLSHEVNIKYINESLVDTEIHEKYTKEQIGIGLNLIYSNTCSDLPFAYIQSEPKEVRIEAINKLKYLYKNYFEKYCISPIEKIGNETDDGRIGWLCYMLWDIFVLNPWGVSDEEIDAGVNAMKISFNSSNDNCIVSSLHGLGHWSPHSQNAKRVIEEWIESPTTMNQLVIDYAVLAKDDRIQ